MVKTGLVSITFRSLSVEKIIQLVSQAGLDAIEWGGDIHVPHGDVVRAQQVAKMTAEAELEVAAYGSYYRVGCENKGVSSFNDVVQTALALKAPLIRIWAGNKGSDKASSEWREKVVHESRQLITFAEKKGIKLAYEFHENTLTDTGKSALRLLREVNHHNIYTYWQPPHNLSVNERAAGLKKILPWLTNIHVFHWTDSFKRKRHPLEKGKEEWQQYLKIAVDCSREHYALLEFVEGDAPEQFLQDARTLKKIIEGIIYNN